MRGPGSENRDQTTEVRALVAERDALLCAPFSSLDYSAIAAWHAKVLPDQSYHPLAFIAGIHMVRLCLRQLSAAEKRLSARWLAEHGFKGPFGGDPHEEAQRP